MRDRCAEMETLQAENALAVQDQETLQLLHSMRAIRRASRAGSVMATALLLRASGSKMVIETHGPGCRPSALFGPRLLATAFLAVALVWPAASHAGQQPPKSLGEIAREEAERRKVVTPTTVYTREHLPKGIKLPLTPAGAAAPAADDKDRPEKGEPARTVDKADPGEPTQKDETWWRTRVTEVREALRRGEMFAQALQTRINSLAADFAARDDPMQRAQIAVDRNKAIAELDLTTTEIKSLRQQLADLEEEARRSGVPPGWLR